MSKHVKLLQAQIQEYKTKHLRRTWKQKHELNALWVELLYWELVEEGKIQIDPLWFKAQEFWKTLKKSYQRKGKWPYEELKVFLTKQPSEYTEYLINFIQQENKKEYRYLLRWLKKFK